MVRFFALVCLILGVFFTSAVPARADLVHLEAGHEIYWLPPHLEFFEDTTQKLTLDEVRARGSFTPMGERGFGHPAPAYWVRFDYTSDLPPDAYYLFLGYKPTLVDTYLLRGTREFSHQHSGNSV